MTPAGVDILKAKVALLPGRPGVYRMLSKTGKVLYVGKAKNLKKRVISYTKYDRLPVRLQRMVSEVNDLIVVETPNEAEAFLLENELIKKYRPYYNILLKDDKSFPYIFMSANHPFPRVTKYRGSRVEKGDYFGPYASAAAINEALAVLQKVFLLRTCTDSMFAMRTRPCLLYQIKRCSAPCTGEISEEEYYEQNIELLKAALIEGYKNDFEGASLEINGEYNLVVNKASGEIYFLGDRSDMFGGSKNLFFVAKFDKNILNDTQKNINSILTSTTSSFDINFEFTKSIRENLSKEVYNDFSNYLLKQKYDFNGKGLSFSKEAIVLNISQYITDYNAFGNRCIQFLVIDGNMIYTARLENAMPPRCDDWGIGQLMGYSNNIFKITAVKDFAEFGVDGAEQGGGEAENGGYALDLSEAPISRAEAASLAFDIWSLNPGKDMDIIFPANDSGLEM